MITRHHSQQLPKSCSWQRTRNSGYADDGLLPRFVQPRAQLRQQLGGGNPGAEAVAQPLLHPLTGRRNDCRPSCQFSLVRRPLQRRAPPPTVYIALCVAVVNSMFLVLSRPTYDARHGASLQGGELLCIHSVMPCPRKEL